MYDGVLVAGEARIRESVVRTTHMYRVSVLLAYGTFASHFFLLTAIRSGTMGLFLSAGISVDFY